MLLDQKEKADERGNAHQPEFGITPREKAETADRMADATQSVKRGRLADVERRTILGTIEDARGNMSEAARLLGIDRRTLYRKVNEYRANGFTADLTSGVNRADPWLTLGLLRDDLKIVRALLLATTDPGNVELAMRRTLRALHRIGDGELTAEAWR